ncbi:MAG: flagellar cap protein FliD N-terminal domain-containing protein, partial [Coprococcus sp.]
MNIGGLSGTTSSTIRGYGGLASGLDRDSLIEGMTSGTTAKINKQQQKKTLLQWEQTAIRNITDKLTSFADKYTSTYASGTNLFSSSLWGRNKITALGANSKYVSVSGSANTADTLEIQRIKQLAKKAQLTSSDRVSDSTLQTGKIDLTEQQKSENLEGKTLTFNYGDKEYSVTLPTGQDKDGKEYKYDTLDHAIESMNRAFKDVEVSGGKKLSDIITVEKNGNKIQFTDKEKAGNTLELTGGSAVEYLGFNKKDADGNFEKIVFTNTSATSNEDVTEDKLITKTPFIDRIAGKSLTFNYNGTSKTIKMPTKEELEKASQDGKLSETLKTSMQTQLDEAFGKGRVKVDFVDARGSTTTGTTGSFTFKTTTPDGQPDNSSVLALSSADIGMLGENGAFKTAYGESNRVNLNSTLAESGLKGADKLAKWFEANPDKKFAFTINDGIKDVKIEISKDDTMQDVMNRINEETSVQVTYQSTTDKFVFTSKNEGASGSFKFEPDSGNEEILKGIFGHNITDEA